MYTKRTEDKIESGLLATHISNNPGFTDACMSGDGSMIMEIIEIEMEKNNLYSKGSKKLKTEIINLLQGKSSVSPKVGQSVLFFVYNSRLSGIGLAVN